LLPRSLKHAALRAAEMVVGVGSGGGAARRDSDEGDRAGAPNLAQQWTCPKCSFRQKCWKVNAPACVDNNYLGEVTDFSEFLPVSTTDSCRLASNATRQTFLKVLFIST
jgi:hypothetical protein